MNVPALSKVESVLLIGGVAIAAYLVYRLYSAGSSITTTVGATVDKIGDSISDTWHAAELAAAKARTTIVGAGPASPDDQSDAESARLARQNAEAQWNGMPSIYDEQWNIKPEYDPTQPTVMGLNNESTQPALDYSPEPFTYA